MAHAQSHSKHDDVHVASIKMYVIVFLALMLGTFLTVKAAYLDFGASQLGSIAHLTVALVIAFVKSALVVLYFMHVKGNSPLVALCVLSGIFFMIIMIMFIMADYLTRPLIPTNFPYQYEKHLPAQGGH